MLLIQNGIVLLICFLIGAIPFSVLVGKYFYNVDVRQYGSGNPGATNTLRTLGPKAGIIVLVLDILKGIAAVFFAARFQNTIFLSTQEEYALGGGLAILGHIFSPFLKFRGGKGVATTVGVMLTVSVTAGFSAIGLFLLLLAITRYVSVASICSVLLFAIIFISMYPHSVMIISFSIVLFFLITVKHRSNIDRLMKGNENKFTLMGKK